MHLRRTSILITTALLACSGSSDETTSTATPESVAEPADEVAPEFDEDGALTASATGRLGSEGRQVVLRWSAAHDDLGVTAYELRVDGEVQARIDAPAEEGTLEEVAFERARTFEVVALDAAGHRSPPLTTDDALAPWFPEGAEVELQVRSPRLTIRWPAAEDDRGVVRYLVRRGGEQIASLGEGAREHQTTGSAAAIVVVAQDAAGHETELAGERAEVSVDRDIAEAAGAAVAEQAMLEALAEPVGALAEPVEDVGNVHSDVGVDFAPTEPAGSVRDRNGSGFSNVGRGELREREGP